MSAPPGRYSITMPRDIAEAAKARGGPSGLSAYVADAEHGPVTDEEIQALRDQLHQARRQRAYGARHAAELLADAGRHGHTYAIDAMLGATALAATGPTTVLTSDPEDLTALCGSRITVIKV
ncbi:hypothetical protein AB0G86_05195 [Streptomyces scabiei]|uniref:hypothetical protein n=1 Tax=Streptomyces scabiei TaxID=1930 RepID=UPI00340AFDCC